MRCAARAAVAITLPVAIALASCASEAPAPRVHQVAIRGMRFEPAALVVAVGDTVVWTNEDLVPHTATAPGRFDSGSIASQARWQHVVTAPGAVAYTCTFHPMMTATLTVR